MLHGITILWLGGAFCHLLKIEVLQACLNPPQVAKGVAYSSHAITKGQGSHLSNRGRSSREGLLIHHIAIGDIEAQEARGSRPLLSCIKCHDNTVANFGFGMADGAILIIDPP